MAQEYDILGYSFKNTAEGEKANKELSAVQYIQEQLREDQPEQMLKLYQGLIDRHFFHTIVGYDFLRKLQELLLRSPAIDPARVPAIPVTLCSQETVSEMIAEVREKLSAGADGGGEGNDGRRIDTAGKEKENASAGTAKGTAAKNAGAAKEARLKSEVQKYKSRSRTLTAVSAALLLAVIAMFFIAGTSDSPTIINYKNSILDQYSSWEEELTERENELRKKERDFAERTKQTGYEDMMDSGGSVAIGE